MILAITAEIASGLLILAAAAAGLGALVFWTLKRSRDPGSMGVKWLITLPLFGVIAVSILWLGVLGPFVIVLCAVILSWMWTPHLGAALASPLTNLYDGGSEEVDPRPFYSIARARQKQGRYGEALELIQAQLEKFPNDVEGQIFLAQVQAEDLKDLAAAELTIETCVAQPGHAPKDICSALYSLADWHLKIGRDREGAIRALSKVGELLPETEYALGAAQRLAHLTETMDLDGLAGKIYAVPKGSNRLGLMRAEPIVLPTETPASAAEKYVRHLEQHPADAEARENLARLYADEFQRPDLAFEQLEYLIGLPHQSVKQVVRWLNLIADLQIRTGADESAVHGTLQRIIDLAPGAAAADLARSRLAVLKLELKGKQRSQAVKLGSYEQNLGLKGRLPHQL